MKYREKTQAYRDILASLRNHPMPPTRVAQAANLHYDRAVKYFEFLETSKLLTRRIEEGRELLAITQEGLKTLEELIHLYDTFRPDLA